MSSLLPTVEIVAGHPVTLSTQVAAHFEKPHCHVMRDIRAIIADLPDDARESNFGCTSEQERQPNFGLTSVDVPMPRYGGTRKSPAYYLSRDGFTLLAMGFTGKKALAWKVRYIQAFNEMERLLMEGKHGQPVPTSGTLLPEQCRHLHNIVDAKLSAVPNELKRKAYSEAWTRFNRHFRIARYEQLPVAMMGDAVTYLIGLELKAIRKALPAPKPEVLPALVPNTDEITAYGKRVYEALKRLREEVGLYQSEATARYGSVMGPQANASPFNAARYAAFNAACTSLSLLDQFTWSAENAWAVFAGLEKAARIMQGE